MKWQIKIMPEPPFVQNESILREMMAGSNGTYLAGTKLVEIGERGITVENTEGKHELECDTVLLEWVGTRCRCR